MHRYYAPKESQIGLWVKETACFVGMIVLIAVAMLGAVAMGA